MRKILGLYSRFAVLVLFVALLAACGNKGTTIASTTTPNVFYSHSVAFRNTSTAFAWGTNTYGQLGNGDNTGTTQTSPIQILTHVAGIVAGGTHTLALSTSGVVYSWGNNGFGQLGNNSTSSSSTPVPVSLLTGTASAIAAGGSHSLALQTNGVVWAWGDNEFGQLGNTPSTSSVPLTPSLIPVLVLNPATGAPLTQVTKIAAGGGHSLALAGLDGNKPVYAWGYNGNGQLGQQSNPGFANLSTSTNRLSAVPVTMDNRYGTGNLLNVVGIAAGGSHSLFVTSDGNVWACGYNFLGQLGQGVLLGIPNITDQNRGAVPVSGLAGVSQVAAGLDHSLALRASDGSVWGWGGNFSGQLGNGAPLASIAPVTIPGQVKKSDGTLLTGVIKIIAIGDSSFAVDGNGQLWAWGDNTFGQLGLGDTTSRSLATKVPTLSSGADLYHP